MSSDTTSQHAPGAEADAAPQDCPACSAKGAEEAPGRGGVPAGEEASELTDGKRFFKHGVVAGTRFMAAIPAAGLLLSALALTLRTLVDVCENTAMVVLGEVDMQTMLVNYIECADFFLLSIVLYIMSIGLYSLFIDPDIHMPGWLEIRDLDDLKEKLVGVIVVVMGVYFLGQLIHGSDTLDLLRMGLSIGAVVFSLAYFVRHVISRRG